MKITIITLFPEMFQGPFGYSILKKAQDKKLINISFVNIRDFGLGRHKTIDDTPFGGGTGMIMRVDVLSKAISKAKRGSLIKPKIILLDARGKTFNQQKAQQLSRIKHLILVCGHYEGIDQRIEKFVDEKISIGNFVVTGGEIPAMLITDAISRLVKGVLKKDAVQLESFSKTLSAENKTELNLEYPQYTKPRTYKGLSVPNILLSGNHKEIDKWKKANLIKAGRH